MSAYVCFVLVMLANAASIVRGRCTNTVIGPEITVANSEYLRVNWSKSFEGCDKSDILKTVVQHGIMIEFF